MKNRDPRHWGGSQQLEHVLGKYILSGKPMTEEQWAWEASRRRAGATQRQREISLHDGYRANKERR
jgi:hypothetical protein